MQFLPIDVAVAFIKRAQQFRSLKRLESPVGELLRKGFDIMGGKRLHQCHLTPRDGRPKEESSRAYLRELSFILTVSPSGGQLIDRRPTIRSLTVHSSSKDADPLAREHAALRRLRLPRSRLGRCAGQRRKQGRSSSVDVAVSGMARAV